MSKNNLNNRDKNKRKREVYHNEKSKKQKLEKEQTDEPAYLNIGDI